MLSREKYSREESIDPFNRFFSFFFYRKKRKYSICEEISFYQVTKSFLAKKMYKLLRNVRLTKKKYLQRIMKFLEDSAIIEEKIAKTKG